MKSQKEINQAFKTLVACELEDYPEALTPWDIFIQGYGYNITRLGEQESVKQWMLGLPSLLSMPYTYYDIGQFLEKNNLSLLAIDYYDPNIQDILYWRRLAMLFCRTYKPKTNHN